jgi:hypothetical protein
VLPSGECPSFLGPRRDALAPPAPLHYSSPREAVKVVTLASILGTLSGLRFVAPELEPPVMVATSIAMHIVYGVICRVFAAQVGRNGLRWGVAGLLGGILPLAALVLLIDRQ